MAVFQGEKAFYVDSVKYAAISVWATGTAAAGDLCRQVSPALNAERVFICIVGGAKSGSEPAWNTGRGVKTTDTSATWIECTGNPAMNGDTSATSGINWNNVKTFSVSQGQVITDVAGTHVFICTTAGNTGSGSEPSWSLGAVGNTTVDNTVTWTYVGLTSSFGKFKVPHARINNVTNNSSFLGFSSGATNVNVYVGSDHAETQASGWSMSNCGSIQFSVNFICCAVAGNIPPTTLSDLATTASVTTTASSGMTLSFCGWMYGIQWTCATSGNNSFVFQGASSQDNMFEQCKFMNGAGAGGNIFKNNQNGSSGHTRMKDCTFKFSGTNQQINSFGRWTLDNCVIDGAGSMPSLALIQPTQGCVLLWKNSDLSNLGAISLINGAGSAYPYSMNFVDCKLGSTTTFDERTATTNEPSTGGTLLVSRCSSSAKDWMFSMSNVAAKLDADNTIYRTGGAFEGSTSFGWTVQTNASATNQRIQFPHCPFELPPIAYYNSKTGQNVTVTVFGIANAAAVPTNAQVWMEVEYPGTSGNTQSVLNISNRAATILSADVANQTADSASGWDGGATARANTTAYTVGQVIKVASNPGRIFFCTTAGTTAGSEPGGYASAVDGGSVTDNTAVFRAGCRFKMAVTLSAPQPQNAGNIYVCVKTGFGVATTGYTFCIDPQLVVT